MIGFLNLNMLSFTLLFKLYLVLSGFLTHPTLRSVLLSCWLVESIYLKVVSKVCLFFPLMLFSCLESNLAQSELLEGKQSQNFYALFVFHWVLYRLWAKGVQMVVLPVFVQYRSSFRFHCWTSGKFCLETSSCLDPWLSADLSPPACSLYRHSVIFSLCL